MANRNAPNPFYRHLNSTTAGSIVPKDRTLVAVDDSDSLSAALKKLSDHRIISAPVFDKDNVCVGSISAETVINYLWGSKSQPPDWSSVKLSAITVKDALGSGLSAEPLVPFFENNPLSMLAALLKTGVHRVALFTQARELVRTCSETDLVVEVRKLIQSKSDLSQLGEASLQSLKIIDTQIVAVKDTAPVQEVLRQLAQNKVSALAVVTSSGKLQANFSASDLRGLVESNLGDLRMEVVPFLEQHSPSAMHPVTLNPTSSLNALLDIIVAKKLHRVWVVDEKEHPRGVISLTDIVGLLSSDTVNARQVAGDIKGLWRQGKFGF